MSVVLNHSRKLLIALQKSELNYRLMILSNRMQRTAAQTQELVQNKADITNAQMKELIDSGVTDITINDIAKIGYATNSIDTELTLLAIKDNDMEAEMKMIDTQLQALNAEEEQIDKVIDSSAKKEFGIFAGS